MLGLHLLKLLFLSALMTVLVPVWIFAAAASGHTELHHSVYLGGIYLGGVTTTVEEDDSRYRIEARAQSNDIFSWMFEWIAVGTSEGVKKQGGIVPVQHTHDSRWNDKKRTANIDFKPNGTVSFEATGKKKRNPKKYLLLDPDTVHNSLDPLSAIMTVGNWLSQGRKCAGEVPVFDGRRRYNVRLFEKPAKFFRLSEYSAFNGMAQGCRVEVEKIGGFKRELSDFEKMQREVVIWVAAPLQGGPYVPVRMQVKTDLGHMELHLDRIKRGTLQLVARNYE